MRAAGGRDVRARGWEQQSLAVQRRRRAHHGRQLIEVDADQLGDIFAPVTPGGSVGEHERYRLAYEPDPVGGEHRLAERAAQRARAGLARSGPRLGGLFGRDKLVLGGLGVFRCLVGDLEILGGQHGHDAGPVHGR